MGAERVQRLDPRATGKRNTPIPRQSGSRGSFAAWHNSMYVGGLGRLALQFGRAAWLRDVLHRHYAVSAAIPPRKHHRTHSTKPVCQRRVKLIVQRFACPLARAERGPDTEHAERAEHGPDAEYAERGPGAEHAEHGPDAEHAERGPNAEQWPLLCVGIHLIVVVTNAP